MVQSRRLDLAGNETRRVKEDREREPRNRNHEASYSYRPDVALASFGSDLDEVDEQRSQGRCYADVGCWALSYHLSRGRS